MPQPYTPPVKKSCILTAGNSRAQGGSPAQANFSAVRGGEHAEQRKLCPPVRRREEITYPKQRGSEAMLQGEKPPYSTRFQEAGPALRSGMNRQRKGCEGR